MSVPRQRRLPAVRPGAQLRRARTLVLAAGLVVALGIAACCLLAPRPIDVSDGMSWFGVTPGTVEVYAATLLLTAALLWGAGRALAGETALRPLRDVLLAAAVLLPVLLATPYTASPAMNWTHMTVGAALFVLQLAVVGWLWWSRSRTPAVLALLVVQTAGGIVCFVSVLDLAGVMLYGQLVFQAAFTASVVVALTGELRRDETPAGPAPARSRVRRH